MTVRVLVIVGLAGLGLALFGGAAAEATSPATHAAKKKRKCKAGRIPVKVLGRTRCKRTRAALPRPRDADTRLLLLRQALDVDLGGVRDRRGRRAPTVKKLFRRLGPRAYAFMQRQLPRALAAADRAAAASRSAGAAGAGVDCKQLAGLLPWGGFSESGPNGMKLELRSNGNDLEVTLEADKGGQRFRIAFGLDGCSLRDVVPMPDCPRPPAGSTRGPSSRRPSRSLCSRTGSPSSRTRSPWTATPRSTPRSATTPSSTL